MVTSLNLMSLTRTTAAVFAAVSLSLSLIVGSAADAQQETVFVRVALDAPSAPRPDPIDIAINDAHGRGQRVYAVVQPLVAGRAGELPVARAHVIYRHPEWLMVPRGLALELLPADVRAPDYLGRLVRWTRSHADRGESLYLSPLQAEASEHIAAAVARIAIRYAVDGIHLDEVRFPGDDFDYSRPALTAFRRTMQATLPAGERSRLDEVETLDPFGYPEQLTDEWRRFRVTRLTALITRVRTAVRAARPEVMVSAGVVRGADRALVEHFQDWRTWLDNGFVDALAERAGTVFVSSYETLVDSAPATESH